MQKQPIIVLLVFVCGLQAAAQEERRRLSLKDSLDGKLDFSDWMIDADGFIPIPYLITEPAVGIGGAIMPVLLHKRRQPSSPEEHKRLAPIPPDITGAMGMYTANKSWAIGAGRRATIKKWGMRYRILAGYASINLKFYKELPVKGETEFAMNIKTIPVYLRVQKQLGFSNWHAGLQYGFTSTTARSENAILPDSVFKPVELDNIGSIPGILVEYDKRDNIFTPDKGTMIHFHANWSDHIFGSDFDYVHLKGFVFGYIPFSHRWICGLRTEMDQVTGDAPFYFLPSIDLRGVPKARYQGKVNILAETEQRWNITRRWSAVFFTGVGKAFDEYGDFSDAQWVYNYGTGFRYLLARKFELYMGADIARGPEQWGFYIQFGSAWLR